MFGIKLKTWMENHIGRPRKKVQPVREKSQEIGARGLMLESSESLTQSDTGISSGSVQVLSSSGPDNKEGYSTTTMESEKSGILLRHTAISLPSPESAYSTGYSTDGASPGGTEPPEYYINIRTGKHYFPSPAPTPTSPQPIVAFSHLHSINPCLTTSFVPTNSFVLSPGLTHPLCPEKEVLSVKPPSVRSLSQRPPHERLSSRLGTFVLEPSPKDKKLNNLSTSIPNTFEILNFSKSPSKILSPKSQLSSLKFFLKSPKQEKGKKEVNKTPVLENKKKAISPTKTIRWFKQPFQKLGHRRTGYSGENGGNMEVKKCGESGIGLGKTVSHLLGKDNAASPRQRNRIKTNPWLPTGPVSSQNFPGFQNSFSSNLMRNRSCTNTPLQNRKTNEVEALQSRLAQINVKYEESKEYLNKFEKAVVRHIEQKLLMDLSDHSEEDLTLNEMIGTYNESYVYEKETDILSDSDPTDCEDYGTDSEADNGGDEQDSHDDELDFIDNGPVIETDDFPGNSGKCTYHDIYLKKNSFLCNGNHPRKDSESRKSLRREQDSKGKKEKRKITRKSFRGDDEGSRKRIDGRAKQKVEVNENVGGLNLSRVLMQRMMAKNGSKSADGTPLSMRSQRLMNKLKETHIVKDNRKPDFRRSNHQEMFLLDVEADKKYNELITEAKNIFESMQNSPVIQSRKKLNIPEGANKMTNNKEKHTESMNVLKKVDTFYYPHFTLKESEARKAPKNLGLKLTAGTPKKPKKLDFGGDKKSSFKAKSSAHSPLDPLGPTFRNFSVFKSLTGTGENTFGSSSEESEPGKSSGVNAEYVEGHRLNVLGSPIVPIAFQSLDLGKPLTSYCPQSEPVKRKIYSCSETYDKLVKRFENKPKVFEESENGQIGDESPRTTLSKAVAYRGLDNCRRGNQGLSSLEREKDDKRLPPCELTYSPGFGSPSPVIRPVLPPLQCVPATLNSSEKT